VEGPLVENITQNPEGIEIAKVDVEICADISDPSGVETVVLNDNWDGEQTMTRISGDEFSGTYCATIDKHLNKTTTYYIDAWDTEGNYTQSASGYYSQ
jgi:hypothetical protein